MAQKKEVKVRDLKPSKDAKGGAARTTQGASRNLNAAGRNLNSTSGRTNQAGRTLQ